MKRLSFTLLCLFFMLVSCKKKSEPTPQLIDQLSDSQLQILDAAPTDTITKFSDVLFADNTNISRWSLSNDSGYVSNFSRGASILTTDKKKLFICRMTKAGLILSDDTLCSCYPAQPNGLAYVFGSKYINTTHIDPTSICKEPIFGLDCSGMIYQMSKASNLNLIESGTIDYANPKVWNDAFNKSPDFQGLGMKDLSTLPASQLEAGDIIVVPGEHIGMVYKRGTTLGIMNSQGSPDYTCVENSEAGRGPVLKSNIQSWLTNLFKNNNYHVLRIAAVTDIDGNDYTTVIIGTQEWMVENLRTAHYRNGDPIATGLSNTEWSNTNSGAFAVYENNQANNTLYGKLYNWYAVTDPRKICPTGWHIPSDEEWTVLINYLGGPTVAGGKMKELGLTYWKSPNTGASNSSGFSGRPGGYRKDDIGTFLQLGESGYWWSSSHKYLDGAGTSNLYYSLTDCYVGSAKEKNGFSCRCIKD